MSHSIRICVVYITISSSLGCKYFWRYPVCRPFLCMHFFVFWSSFLPDLIIFTRKCPLLPKVLVGSQTVFICTFFVFLFSSEIEFGCIIIFHSRMIY